MVWWGIPRVGYDPLHPVLLPRGQGGRALREGGGAIGPQVRVV